MKMSIAKRAIQKGHIASSYREKRQAAFCPKTGLGEAAWVRLQLRMANYTCQVTGERGVKLVVHHLYSVATHPQLRWDETNIVVVQKTVVLEESNVAQLASALYLLVHSLSEEDQHDTDDASAGEVCPILVSESTLCLVQSPRRRQHPPALLDRHVQA